MRQILCSLLMIIAAVWQIHAQAVRWSHTPEDSVEINSILRTLSALDNPTTTDAAKFFAGRPYVAATLEGDPEMLTVRTDVFDCTTFVETCIAMTLAAKSTNADVEDFVKALTNLRYRDGRVNGYASRLHYISDWICNAAGGQLVEVTSSLPGSGEVVKSLNFMSSHPQSYPALKDNPENITAIEDVEASYQNFKMPYVPALKVNATLMRELKEGDIVAFTTNIKGLDVTHIGLITIKNEVPHLVHASSSAKRVVTTSGSLADYLKSNRGATGIRLFRLIQ